MDYGTGAIFGCPAHDQRDLDFAIKYKLKVMPVVKPKNIDENKKPVCIKNRFFTYIFELYWDLLEKLINSN